MSGISNSFIKRKIENLIRMRNEKNLNILEKDKHKDEIKKEIVNPLFTEEQEKNKSNQS